MSLSIKIFLIYLTCFTVCCFAEQTSTLIVDAKGFRRKIPDTFLGAFFENIEKAQKYKVVFYVKARGAIDLDVSFVGSENGEKLASNKIRASEHHIHVSKWRRMETTLEAKATNHNASLQITTSTRGVVWLDQVSAMPLDTYKLAEDLGALPVWVFNNGISHHDEVNASAIAPFVQV
ncbi:Alpha-L-arabinofuranosidase 1 [Spatholobus suberectus]|nr:Alpha-L-arabinofuranosidase 1 [Spatholobus suberectus]